MEVRRLFEANQESGNFWNTVNGNFLDMCVLDWCKLFVERNGKHSWRRIVADPDAFRTDLLKHLDLDQDAFDEEIRVFREYRDKWVAHLDTDRRGRYPRLEIAKKAVWFYYERIGNEQVDQEIAPQTIETGYQQCREEASTVYRQMTQERRF